MADSSYYQYATPSSEPICETYHQHHQLPGPSQLYHPADVSSSIQPCLHSSTEDQLFSYIHTVTDGKETPLFDYNYNNHNGGGLVNYGGSSASAETAEADYHVQQYLDYQEEPNNNTNNMNNYPIVLHNQTTPSLTQEQNINLTVGMHTQPGASSDLNLHTQGWHEASSNLYDPLHLPLQTFDDLSLTEIPRPFQGSSPTVARAIAAAQNQKRPRSEKKAIPKDQQDIKYFERRKRNNQAAKKSRDARKAREDDIAIRASFLEKENAMLRVQTATLREEANSLKVLLMQKQQRIAT